MLKNSELGPLCQGGLYFSGKTAMLTRVWEIYLWLLVDGGAEVSGGIV